MSHDGIFVNAFAVGFLTHAQCCFVVASQRVKCHWACIEAEAEQARKVRAAVTLATASDELARQLGKTEINWSPVVTVGLRSLVTALTPKKTL